MAWRRERWALVRLADEGEDDDRGEHRPDQLIYWLSASTAQQVVDREEEEEAS